MRMDEVQATMPDPRPEKSADRRRVLLVSPMLTRGGAERFTSTLLTHLDRARFAPFVCLLFSERSYPLPDDVPVTLLGHRSIWTIGRSIHRLRHVMDELQPDSVLSTLAYTSIIVGEALRRATCKPRWIARIGASPAMENQGGFLKFVFGRWQKRVYPWAHALVANSQGTAEEMKRYFPSLNNPIYTIGNPTDFARIDRMAAQTTAHLPSANGPVVISVGRLDPQKRPDLLIEAFARLRQRLLATLWICGQGPWRQRIVRQISASGVADSIRLLGFCDNPYALMSRADLFVMTSDYEGLPNALIEAQGLGICAVSTSCPHGPDEIIAHGQTGLLVRPGDVEGLARAMEELLTDSARRQSMGEAARMRTRELFDVGPLVRKWEQLLSQVES